MELCNESLKYIGKSSIRELVSWYYPDKSLTYTFKSKINPTAMHDVRFSIPERELGKADIEFKIKKGGKVFGTLRVSKGSMVWFPKDKSYGQKTGWIKFDEFMQSQKRFEKR